MTKFGFQWQYHVLLDHIIKGLYHDGKLLHQETILAIFVYGGQCRTIYIYLLSYTKLRISGFMALAEEKNIFIYVCLYCGKMWFDQDIQPIYLCQLCSAYKLLFVNKKCWQKLLDIKKRLCTSPLANACFECMTLNLVILSEFNVVPVNSLRPIDAYIHLDAYIHR